MAIATLSIDIEARLARLETELSKAAHIAEKNAKKMEEAFGSVNSAIKKIAGSIGVIATAKMFAGLIKDAIDAQDELKDLSKSTSLSVETLAGLGVAALKSGSDLDSIATSINKLSQNMGKDSEKFKAIGITAKDPIEAFKQLADVYNAIQDPQTKAAFAAEALGKAWAGAAPLLAEGSEAIGKMVKDGSELSKVTSESAAKADELNDKLVDLQTITGSLTTRLANALVPSLLETAKAIDELSRSSDALESLWNMFRGSVGSQRLSFDPGFAGIGAQIKDLEAELAKLEDKQKGIAAAGGEGWITKLVFGESGEIERKISIIRNQLDGLRKYGDVTKNSPLSQDAPLSGSKVSPDVSKFINEEKKTKKKKEKDDYTDPLTKTAEEYAKALKSIADAEASAFKSTLNLNGAQSELFDLYNSPLWAEMPETWRAIVQQQADMASASIDAANAQKRLNDLLAETPTAQLEEARKDMELLTDALKNGQISEEQYLEAVNKRLSLGSEQIEEQTNLAKELGLTFSSAFEDAIVKGKGFSDVLKGIAEDIVRLLARKNITEPLAKSVGSFDWGSLFSSSSSSSTIPMQVGGGYADGGVFSSPSLSAYSGGVYSTPKFFKFASGAGVFGEAGPEAIMPLKRGKDGKLGVSTDGSGGSVTVNVINNASGTETTQRRRQGSNGENITDIIISAVKNDLIGDIGGGGEFSGALETQYGLNRSAGAWR